MSRADVRSVAKGHRARLHSFDERRFSMRNILSFMLASSVVLSAGCIAEIDERVDCNNLCNRYQSCFDSAYDTAACRTRCQTLVDGADPSAANQCDACLGAESCVGSFTCADECYGLLP